MTVLWEDLQKKAEEKYPGVMLNRTDTEFLFWLFHGQYLEQGFTVDELITSSRGCFDR